MCGTKMCGAKIRGTIYLRKKNPDEAMLERTWQDTRYPLDVLRATNGAHIKVH